MLKISRTTNSDDGEEGELLQLEGQVIGPWVEELRRVCSETVGRSSNGAPSLVLDLTNVSFIDADGVELLRRLMAGHVSLTNCSMFVTEQLKEVAHADR